jgi:hypothetical protein
MSTSMVQPGMTPLPPWVDKERNGCLQSLIVGGFVILVLAGLGCLIGALVYLTEPGGLSGTGAVGAFVTTLVILAASVVGMVFLAPQLKVPAAFKSHYVGPSNVLGSPFEIRFTTGYANGDRGTIWFSDYGIQVTGKENVSCGLWFFIGWLAYFFRQNYVRDVPYQAVSLVSVVGKTVIFATPVAPIQRLRFRVALEDGERLYRELCYHFPAQMQQYQALFANSPSVKPATPSPAGPLTPVPPGAGQ